MRLVTAGGGRKASLHANHYTQTTNHCTQTILHKPLYTSHCIQTILHKPLCTNQWQPSHNHYTQTIIHKPLYTNHYTQTIIHQPLYTNHYTQTIIHQPSSCSPHERVVNSVTNCNILRRQGRQDHRGNPAVHRPPRAHVCRPLLLPQ